MFLWGYRLLLVIEFPGPAVLHPSWLGCLWYSLKEVSLPGHVVCLKPLGANAAPLTGSLSALSWALVEK